VKEFLARPHGWFFHCNPPYRLDRYGNTHQGYRLHYMMRRVAKRAAFVIDLSERMRVHDLNEPGQQDQRNTENPEPSRPGCTDPRQWP